MEDVCGLHCQKDPFALPRIDQVIDSTAGCVFLSFLDCYSGYHQIALKEEDQIKTAFITPFGAYAYSTMSFGLKNAGDTYLRAIQLCLTDHYTATLKLTWMMWSSRPDPTMSSSLILRRLSIACDGFDGRSTRQSAYLACLKANYSGSLSITIGSKQIQRRSTPS
jgi:hypothetical protein